MVKVLLARCRTPDMVRVRTCLLEGADKAAEACLRLWPYAQEFQSEHPSLCPSNLSPVNLHRHYVLRQIQTQFYLDAWVHSRVAFNLTTFHREVSHSACSTDSAFFEGTGAYEERDEPLNLNARMLTPFHVHLTLGSG